MYCINKKFIVTSLAAFSVVSSAYADPVYKKENIFGTISGVQTCTNTAYKTTSHNSCVFNVTMNNPKNELGYGYIDVELDAAHLGLPATPPHTAFIVVTQNNTGIHAGTYSMTQYNNKLDPLASNSRRIPITCINNTTDCKVRLDTNVEIGTKYNYTIEAGIFFKDQKINKDKTSRISVRVSYKS
jgi:maltoporin